MSLQTRNLDEVLRRQAEILKALSNHHRLLMLHELRSGEKTVTELSSATGLRQANVSQHLALMRRSRVVVERRAGNSVFYHIADKRILEACDLMQSVLLNQASEDSKLVRSAIEH